MMHNYSKLEDVAEVIDSLHKTPSYSLEGYAMVRCTDVKYGRLNLQDTFKVDKDVFKEFSRRYTPQQGDIIITRVGSYGNTAFVEDTNFCLGQNTAAIVPKINPRFLYYALNSVHTKNQIEFSVVGSTQKTLSLKAINNLEIPRFESFIEDKIAEIIGSLDDKIDLNRQINRTLEAMAQAIFKSWFVDFDPVKAKIAAIEEGQDPLRAAMSAISGKNDAELDAMPRPQYEELAATAALFPDEMVESELGDVPKGWEVKNISDYLSNISKTFPLKKVDKVIFLNTGDIKEGEFFHRSFSKADGLPGQAKKSIAKGDILYSEIRPENKRYAYVYFDADSYVVSTKLMVLRATGSIDTKFLYFILRQQSVVDFLQMLAESRSGTFPQITFDVLSKVNFIAPEDDQITKVFTENFLTPIMNMTTDNGIQIAKLSELRDTLLPKLLSGELSVDISQPKQDINQP